MAKLVSRATRLRAAQDTIQTALDELEALHDGLEDWLNAWEGTNLENSSKFSDIEAAMEQLAEARTEIESILSDLDGVEFPTVRS